MGYQTRGVFRRLFKIRPFLKVMVVRVRESKERPGVVRRRALYAAKDERPSSISREMYAVTFAQIGFILYTLLR